MNNTGVIILSILCPTTPDRSEMFGRVSTEVVTQILKLEKEHPMLGKVEFAWDSKKRFLDGGLSIGKRREGLLKRAVGKYVCFLDSDDTVAPNYIEELVRLCQADRDVCTFRAIAKNDNFWSIIDMSIYHPNIEANPNYITLRSPWHVAPIRSSIAQMYDFEDTNYGEDFSWLQKVLQHVTTEARSTAVLLEYNHSKNHSEADKITNHFKNALSKS